jgi:small subunit ribosomal protein S4
MGEPRRLSRKYSVPKKMWNKQKILQERNIINEYGLKTKKEVWKAETLVRKFRKIARNLLAGSADDYNKRHDELFSKLINLGILTKDNVLEDVLKLQTTDVLERRLQTQVFKKGLSLTPKQARQLITHGHIAVNGVIRTAPSSFVKIKDEISYASSKIKAVVDRSIEEKGKINIKEEPKEKKEEESKE